MRKVLKLILSVFFYSVTLSVYAQNKYAVLVAINDYYNAPGVKHPSSLSGCVNDAGSMKELLVDRFGFAAANVYSLYNAEATKKNFIDHMNKVLHASKAGDAVVFFYSGHGVWMTNPMLEHDRVKRGMSQAIVMSDLYSPGWDCLVKDETLKDIFNHFVNKKIILTTIFDCCYSANLPMKIDTRYWTASVNHRKNLTQKDLDINSIPYVPKEEKPAGCRIDMSGNIIDTLDTDRDGLPDCKDWEIFSPAYGMVDSLGVVREVAYNDFITQPDNYYDPAKFTGDAATQDESTRSFNLRDVITVSNSSSLRPSDRKNSGFLSLAGSMDNQKGLEIYDVSALKHGAFTAALVHVYRNNPPGLPVSQLMKKLTSVMADQSFHQIPKFHFDPARLNGNMIGVGTSGFSNRIKAECISNQGGVIKINKGQLAGVAKGNIFSDVNRGQKQKIQITEVFPGYATAVIKTNGPVRPGQAFEMTDDHIVSNPLIKIYIPGTPFTPASFDLFFKNKIMPQVNRPDYRDYHFLEEQWGNTVIMWDDADKFKKTLNPYGDPGKNAYYVLLPVPSYIADPLKIAVSKDQNIEIVDDPAKAQYGIYLNYAKPGAASKGEFVLYIHPVINGKVTMPADIFSLEHVAVPALTINNAQIISKKLYEQARKVARYTNNSKWMNTYPKR